MTEKHVRDLLAAVAERGPLPSPALAAIAWRSARRKRRRRQMIAVIGAAAAMAVVATTVVVDRIGGQPALRPATSPGAAASPRTTLAGVIQVAPAGGAEGQLPWADTRLRGGLDLDVDRAAPLSKLPAGHALAVVQSKPSAPVLVLGDDGKMRRIDRVRLEPNVDAGGNGAPILDSTALSPDGTRLALLQPGEAIVVDLSSGQAKRFSVPGVNLRAIWHPDRSHLLVSHDGAASVLLDTQTGSLAPVPYSGGDAALGADGTIVELLSGSIADDSPANPAVLRRRSPDGAVVIRREPSPMIATWHGAPFLQGGRVARAAFTTKVDAPGLAVQNPQAVAVVNARTGRLNRLLAIDYDGGHPIGCCPALGWLDAETVLIANVGARILAWNMVTGELERVAELPVAAVALGDIHR